MNLREKIFKNASVTHYYASIFFPKDIFQEITTLYAFARVADDYVDSIPQDPNGFYEFRKAYSALVSKKVPNLDNFEISDKNKNVLLNFVELSNKRNFETTWTEAFLDAMESDLKFETYKTIKNLEKYMYGSANVIGLYVCAICQIDKAGYESAEVLGKAYQYANFIRDIGEDQDLRRRYIPDDILKAHGIENLKESTVLESPEKFEVMVREEIERCKLWIKEAKKGYKYLPFRLRVPVMASTNMYEWTLDEIYKNPTIIYKKKVRPSKYRVMTSTLVSFLTGIYV